jgi:hypothetical protein
MKYIILVIILVLSVNLFGQSLTKKEMKYIPKDFAEALVQLDKIIPDSSRARIVTMTEHDFLAQTHFTTGMWIRNYWLYNRYLFGLIVTKSDLRKDLFAKGLFNNDDMSGVILRSYYRKLNSFDIQLEQQIKDVHQWYVNMNNPVWRAQQDSISWSNLMKNYAIGDTLMNNVYYERNWLGTPRKNTTVIAKVIDKSYKQAKIEIISFGSETKRELIYKGIPCDSTNCWINPHRWKKKK